MSLNVAAIRAGRGKTERTALVALRDLAGEVPVGQAIVELGSYKGQSTGWLAWGADPDVPVYAVDPWDTRPVGSWPAGYADGAARTGVYARRETFDAFMAHITACGIAGQVRVMQATGEAAGRRYDGPPVGLLFHDAEHSRDAVEADLRAWLPHLAPAAVVALHDAAHRGLGVAVGAARVLNQPDSGWDWKGRQLIRWPGRTHRRGLLIVRRLP